MSRGGGGLRKASYTKGSHTKGSCTTGRREGSGGLCVCVPQVWNSSAGFAARHTRPLAQRRAHRSPHRVKIKRHSSSVSFSPRMPRNADTVTGPTEPKVSCVACGSLLKCPAPCRYRPTGISLTVPLCVHNTVAACVSHACVCMHSVNERDRVLPLTSWKGPNRPLLPTHVSERTSTHLTAGMPMGSASDDGLLAVLSHNTEHLICCDATGVWAYRPDRPCPHDMSARASKLLTVALVKRQDSAVGSAPVHASTCRQ